MNLIAARFVFNQTSYPKLNQSISEEEKLLFVINHSILHMAKSQGRLATVVEACDHGKKLNDCTLHKLTGEMFIHTLRLAEEAGMTAQELLDLVPVLLKSKGGREGENGWFQKLLPPKQPLE